MFSKSTSIQAVVISIILFFGIIGVAHKGHHHHDDFKTIPKDEIIKRVYEKIDGAYQVQVKPIFQKKCMNCHSSKTEFPFYYNWPIARNMIDKDLVEAKEHINLDKGFPFGGHGTPKEDLEAIEASLKEESMPPLRYRIMHWNSTLSKSEKDRVLEWVKDSKSMLE